MQSSAIMPNKMSEETENSKENTLEISERIELPKLPSMESTMRTLQCVATPKALK